MLHQSRLLAMLSWSGDPKLGVDYFAFAAAQPAPRRNLSVRTRPDSTGGLSWTSGEALGPGPNNSPSMLADHGVL